MEWIIPAAVAALVVGFALGFLARHLWGGTPAGTVRLRTQLEERDRRAVELQATVADRDAALTQAVNRRVELETRLATVAAERDAALRQVKEERALLEDATDKLRDTFKALAGESLKDNSESFMIRTRSELQNLLTPLSDSLKRYDENVKGIEKQRGEAYGSLQNQVLSLMRSETELRKETGNLVQALRRPEVRGRWGELTLRRTVELAGLSEHCDFDEQVNVATEEGRLRPDLIVHLPAGRDIVVDAKVSLQAYLDALDAPTPEDAESKLDEHARQVRQRMNDLASKKYGSQFEKAPEFVVLFMPECVFSVALSRDHHLLEDGFKKRVILASPATLIAVLLAVAHGWHQARLEENARQISAAGQEIYDRISTLYDHLTKMGTGLKRAVDSYNDAVGSFEGRFMPSARRIKELGATAAEDLPVLEPIDRSVRLPSQLDESPAEQG